MNIGLILLALIATCWPLRSYPLWPSLRSAILWNKERSAACGLEDRTSDSFEDFARDRFIIGDKVSVKEEILRYRELLGVDHFIMRCQWPGLPQERVLGSIQRLGEIFAP